MLSKELFLAPEAEDFKEPSSAPGTNDLKPSQPWLQERKLFSRRISTKEECSPPATRSCSETAPASQRSRSTAGAAPGPGFCLLSHNTAGKGVNKALKRGHQQRGETLVRLLTPPGLRPRFPGIAFKKRGKPAAKEQTAAITCQLRTSTVAPPDPPGSVDTQQLPPRPTHPCRPAHLAHSGHPGPPERLLPTPSRAPGPLRPYTQVRRGGGVGGRTPPSLRPRGPARHSAGRRPRPGPPGLPGARPSRTLTPAALSGAERPAGKGAELWTADHVTRALAARAQAQPAPRKRAAEAEACEAACKERFPT
ncbi:cuticle collagen 7-like [Saccopteryx leptura]|uniref:cuticle collagen 7-like n=1 Tax=Saccopteryx leptura TaxID=249018 RepID=UPI00339BE2A9